MVALILLPILVRFLDFGYILVVVLPNSTKPPVSNSASAFIKIKGRKTKVSLNLSNVFVPNFQLIVFMYRLVDG